MDRSSDDVDFLTKSTIQEFMEALSVSDEEFIKHQESEKEFRNVLISLVKK